MLSGGERNRVHLAKMLTPGGNVLLLDEPTNDLDVDTLRALEDGLDSVRRLRRGHQPRPLVPRPGRHPRARLRGRLRRCAGSRATSATTRRSAARSSAPTPTSRTASSTSRWCDDHGARAGADRRSRRGAVRPEGPRSSVASCYAVFVAGIAGMIVSSIADNNGTAITCGLVTAVAVLGLVLVTSVSPPGSLAKPGTAVPTAADERLAADLEDRIGALVADGADEETLRKLVGRRRRARSSHRLTVPSSPRRSRPCFVPW